jgi:hypothetical protein
MDSNTLLIIGVLVWLIWVVFWLFKRKLRIFKRLGYDLTADQLIQKGKEGDKEVQKLVRDTKIVGLVGILIFFGFSILQKYLG